MAIKNIYGDNPKYEISRYVNLNGTYKKANFPSKNKEEIKTLVNKISQGVTNIVKENMWINTDLSVVPDKTTVGMKYRKSFFGTYNTHIDKVKFNWIVKTNENLEGFSYHDIINDSSYLKTYEKMIENLIYHTLVLGDNLVIENYTKI